MNKDFFNKNLNISYVDESLPKPSIELAIKHYLCSAVLYSIIFILLSYNPFFKDYFPDNISFFYAIALCSYITIAPIIYLVFRPRSLYQSHSIHIYEYFKNVFINIYNASKNKDSDYKDIINIFTPTYYQKQSLMLMFIKVFFGTLMTNFLNNNIPIIAKNITHFQSIFGNAFANSNFSLIRDLIVANQHFIWKFAIIILFSIDISVFIVGYLTETTFLKNKIRTVDTNIIGVLFCLACYPPFNIVTNRFFGWHQSDNSFIYLENTGLAWTLRFLALFCLIIYTSASIALGTKASNLTNRGTVSIFPYNIVRHPAYISKNLFWLFTTIPFLIVNTHTSNFDLMKHLAYITPILCSYLAWASIYYFRAIYEERHLMQDPDYQEYAKKVKYRFIPYIF